jgi:hypothetical protein
MCCDAGPNTFSCMANHLRAEDREDAALPLYLADGCNCITRDVSTSGVYFESDEEQRVGSEIDFSIDFDSPTGPLNLKCRGTVLRTERRGERIGTAVKILQSRFSTGHSGFGPL